MNSSSGIILWILGFTGFLFAYAGIKNENPIAIIAHYVTPGSPPPAKLGSKNALPAPPPVVNGINPAQLGTPNAGATPAAVNV